MIVAVRETSAMNKVFNKREQYGLECTEVEQRGRVIDIEAFSGFEEF